MVIATSYILFKTSFGLRLRAVGEKPEAIDSAGLSVSSMRFQAILIAGLLTGIAGAYLSTAHGAGFVREMTAGKGYIALAAMIFGKWRPGPALGSLFDVWLFRCACRTLARCLSALYWRGVNRSYSWHFLM